MSKVITVLAKSVFDMFGSTLNLKTVVKRLFNGHTEKAEKQAGRQEGRQPGRQVDRQTEGQMNKRTGGQIERQRDGLLVRHMLR